MQVKISKWGNSLAMRLPAVLVEELELEAGTEVDISRRGKEVRVVPVKPRARYELSELLKGVTAENTHPEIPTGHDRGKEVIE